MLQTILSRRSLLVGGSAVAGSITLGAVGSPAAYASGSAAAMTPDEAWMALAAGNKRAVAGKLKHPHQSRERVGVVAKGQSPFAVILGCADSRVSPELLFDQGYGDLFVNRVAGNLVNENLLGSMEYAISEFNSPLIVVLGHERCGAVAATQACVRAGSKAEGSIQSLVEALTPIVGPFANETDAIEMGVQANAKAQAAAVLEQSEIIKAKVEKGTTKIVSARYDLDTSKVTLLT